MRLFFHRVPFPIEATCFSFPSCFDMQTQSFATLFPFFCDAPVCDACDRRSKQEGSEAKVTLIWTPVSDDRLATLFLSLFNMLIASLAAYW